MFLLVSITRKDKERNVFLSDFKNNLLHLRKVHFLDYVLNNSGFRSYL